MSDARYLGGDSDTVLAPMSLGGATTEGTATHEQALAWQEHVANVRRLRRAISVGTVLWVLFGAVDVLAALLIEPPALPWLLGLRACFLAVALPVIWRLHRLPIPSASVLRAFDLVIFGAAALIIALMCVRFGGLESVYAAGLCLVIVARGVFVAESWRQATLPLVVMVGSYPAVLGASSWFHEGLRAQLGDPTALGHAAVYLCMMVGTAVFTTLATHSYWQLRRQALDKRVVGEYRLDRLLGAGGMGEVWCARSRESREPVAIKLLRATGATAAEAILRFEREVAALSRLRHPNTVRIHDYGVTEDGIWYYVMEYVDGEPLSRRVERQGPASVARALDVADQVAQALSEAHAAGIVHRDVKPENVVVTLDDHGSDRVKLLDFGIAWLADSDDVALTQTGAIVGSPAYMAPEAAAGERTDARADVYGVGVLLYLLVTGSPPFAAATRAELLERAMRAHPRRPSELRGTPVPEHVERLIVTCMARDPARRFADARALCAAIAECRAELAPSESARGWRDPVTA
jgi:eukaryotic-like serine/threonine-protein kinase